MLVVLHHDHAGAPSASEHERWEPFAVERYRFGEERRSRGADPQCLEKVLQGRRGRAIACPLGALSRTERPPRLGAEER